jgi:hypothetical protein
MKNFKLLAVLLAMALPLAVGCKKEGAEVDDRDDTATSVTEKEKAGVNQPGDLNPVEAQTMIDDVTVGKSVAADGTIANWAFETGGANALYRRGWKKTDLPVGEMVTIEGFLARDGSRHVNATNIKLPGGRQLFAGSSGTGSPGKPASQP